MARKGQFHVRLKDINLPAIEAGLEAVEAGKCHFIDVHVSTGYAVPPLMRGGSKGE